MNCFVKFNISSDTNFNDLKSIFDLIKMAKNSNLPKDDSFWLNSFPDYVLKKFYFLDTDKKPDFETANQNKYIWHFYSLIDLLQINYGLEYINCFKTPDGNGQLDYYPYEYPYGGITGLITFINSFECIPTIINDGTSTYKIDFLNNGDFSITDLEDTEKQNSSKKLFNTSVLLHKFTKRFK